MSLITKETVTLDRRYIADDITFTALYLGLDVRNTRFSTYRNVCGCGTSIEIREGLIYSVNGISGLYRFYNADQRIRGCFNLNPMARKEGVGDDPLSQLAEYMYGVE